MKKYVIKRDAGSLPEKLTRYREELNHEQFRVVTAKPGAALAIYGPFRYGGQCTSGSNESFDAMLRARDPGSGIRDFEAVDALARRAGFSLVRDYPMPAHNQTLVWKLASAG